MNLLNVIDEAVSTINSSDSSRRKLSDKLSVLREKNLQEFGSSDLLEKDFIKSVDFKPFSGRVAGVDSGFVGKNLFSLDLVLVRAVAALFEYKENTLLNAKYLPNFFSFPSPHLSNNALEKDEFNCSKSLTRLFEEVSLAKKVIEEFSPKYCFLDGSVIPQYADKPRKDSKINSKYYEILDEFQLLYELADEKNCFLVGCVEDSRGSRFAGILEKSVISKEKVCSPESLSNCFDSVLLDYLLKKGERSFAFSYTRSIKDHPILMDFKKEWSDKIFAFYLKPSAFDRPLRIEFVKNGANLSNYADEIASTVFALSSLHREYAYPSVLIEADLRARLKPEEINIVFDKIIDKISKNIKLKLRRDCRPFK